MPFNVLRNSREVGKRKREIAVQYRCEACLVGKKEACRSLGHQRKGQPITSIHVARLLAAGFDVPGFYTTPQPGPGLRPDGQELHKELERAKAQLTKRRQI